MEAPDDTKQKQSIVNGYQRQRRPLAGVLVDWAGIGGSVLGNRRSHCQLGFTLSENTTCQRR